MIKLPTESQPSESIERPSTSSLPASRVERAHRAFTIAAISFEEITVQEDHLFLANSAEMGDCAKSRLQNLLGTRELIDLFHERNRVRGELDEVRAKLRGWLTRI